MFISRQRDRRQALDDMLTALTTALERPGDVARLRETFEQSVQRLVPVRAVRLREIPRGTVRPKTDIAGALMFDVLGGDQAIRTVLEATPEPSRRLGEWDLQMLGLAAHVAALVVEIERGRRLEGGAGLLETNRPKRHQATLLVGVTPPMQTLRATIERVATTDFTVLLEGPSDPQ